jgi:hypothetical protein
LISNSKFEVLLTDAFSVNALRANLEIIACLETTLLGTLVETPALDLMPAAFMAASNRRRERT